MTNGDRRLVLTCYITYVKTKNLYKIVTLEFGFKNLSETQLFTQFKVHVLFK